MCTFVFRFNLFFSVPDCPFSEGRDLKNYQIKPPIYPQIKDKIDRHN